MIEYQESNLRQLSTLGEHAPEQMKTFQAFDKAVFADGILDAKTMELIAVAVGISKQCVYCMHIHTANARKHGATEAEIAEAALVASAIGAGSAITHATHSFAD
jgi:AhpD family alkylhydroperoxidase